MGKYKKSYKWVFWLDVGFFYKRHGSYSMYGYNRRVLCIGIPLIIGVIINEEWGG